LDKKKFQKKDEKWNLAVLCTDIFDTVIESHLRASLTVPYYKEIMNSSVAGSPVARAGLHMIQYCGQEKNFLKLIYQSALSLGNHRHFLVDYFYYHYIYILGLSALQSASTTTANAVSFKSMKTFIQMSASSSSTSTFQMAVLPIDYSRGLANSPDFGNKDIITALCERSLQLIDKVLEVSSLLSSPTLSFALSTFFEIAECSR
jgi:hypothetical protein